jgi:uncharacterized protein YybS (DUF2232 family)
MEKTKDLLLAIGIGLLVAVASVPAALIPVLLLLVPAPFILLALRRGYWTGIVGLIVCGLVYAVVGGPLVGGVFWILTGFLVAGLPILLRRQRPYMEYVLYATGLALLSMVVIMGGYAAITGESLFTAFVAGAERILTENQQLLAPLLAAYRQFGVVGNETTVADLIALLVGQLRDLAPFIPGFLITVAALAGGLNLMIPYRLAVRKGVALPLIPPFSRWRLPRGTFLGFLILGALAFLLTLVNGAIGQPVLYTVSSLFLFAYSIQGLGVAVFLMDRGRLPGALKAILCILIFLFLFATMIPFMLGMLEQFLHIRELLENSKDR